MQNIGKAEMLHKLFCVKRCQINPLNLFKNKWPQHLCLIISYNQKTHLKNEKNRSDFAGSCPLQWRLCPNPFTQRY
jgi:hypothetical protein